MFEGVAAKVRKRIFLLLILAVICLLSACQIRTVDEMYQVPKRPESYNDLQKVIEAAMSGMDYSAPKSGENQQTVQMADLDGDGIREYLLFAKSSGDKPLRILIFSQNGESVVLTDTIACSGTSFDLVEYVQMDGVGGMEIVVGCQISQQLTRSVGVYTMEQGEIRQSLSANYSKFLTCDLDCDDRMELMILRPGTEAVNNGCVELYRFENGILECSGEVKMSASVDKLKRVITGNLHGGIPAVFAASAIDATALITDVYALVDGVFTNITESGVQTLRDRYVYADDIDEDGEVELPSLIPMPAAEEAFSAQQYLICWFSIDQQLKKTEKMHTYHNYDGGWYLKLDPAWADRISVSQKGDEFEFYHWDEDHTSARKIFSIFVFTGQNREEQAVQDNRFVVYKNESVIYAARLEVASGALCITQNDLIESFCLIRQDWKTGEM